MATSVEHQRNWLSPTMYALATAASSQVWPATFVNAHLAPARPSLCESSLARTSSLKPAVSRRCPTLRLALWAVKHAREVRCVPDSICLWVIAVRNGAVLQLPTVLARDAVAMLSL